MDGLKWNDLKAATLPGTLAAVRPDLLYSFETYWKPTESLSIQPTAVSPGIPLPFPHQLALPESFEWIFHLPSLDAFKAENNLRCIEECLTLRSSSTYVRSFGSSFRSGVRHAAFIAFCRSDIGSD